MKPSIYSTAVEKIAIFQISLVCAAVSLLLASSSAYSQLADPSPGSTSTRNPSLQAQIVDVSTHKPEFEKFNSASIDKLIQLADAQSLVGEHENAITLLKEALELNRIQNGLYDYSQISIVDELIANEVLQKNWAAVNDLYEFEEHLLRRLFEPTDARLEIGLEKITAWHIKAVNKGFDGNKQEHFEKVRELMAIRLTVVEKLLGNENARYDFILNNLAYVELELEKFRKRRNTPTGPIGHQYTPHSIE